MYAISPEERGLAVLAHLSGLSSYVVPLGGVLVPIVVWMVNKDSPVIVSIAKQALLLNIMVYIAFGILLILWLTLILIPFAIVSWILLSIVAVVLPIVGALKASSGLYYKYPVVGISPYFGEAW